MGLQQNDHLSTVMTLDLRVADAIKVTQSHGHNAQAWFVVLSWKTLLARPLIGPYSTIRNRDDRECPINLFDIFCRDMFLFHS